MIGNLEGFVVKKNVGKRRGLIGAGKKTPDDTIGNKLWRKFGRRLAKLIAVVDPGGTGEATDGVNEHGLLEVGGSDGKTISSPEWG